MHVLLPTTKECKSYTWTNGTSGMLLCLRKNMVEEEFKLPGVPAEGGADHQNHPSLGSDMMIVGLISGLPIIALALSFALHGSAGLCQSKPPRKSK